MHKRNNEKGFSYLDVMIGMVIMLIGITALVAAITGSVMRSAGTQQQLTAKQIASSSLESIFSARDIDIERDVDGWLKVGNTGNNLDPNTGLPQGIFYDETECPNGFCPVREDAGWDGVVGTVDDACPEGSPCTDGVNPANTSPVVKNFWRKITITDINDPDRPSPPMGTWPIMMRRIDIVVKYHGVGGLREEKVSTIITNYK